MTLSQRQENDFEELSGEEETILRQLAEGLKELNIEPSQILGLSGFMKEEGEGKERKLSK